MADQNKQSDDKEELQQKILSNQANGLSAYDRRVQKIYNEQSTRNFRKPADPRPNPLSKFVSYTYQISLYMITPDAYNAFVNSGRKNINALNITDINGNATGGGAFIVAQSGGVNNTDSRRPPGMEFDYYIDDLKLTSNINGKNTTTSSFVTDISFNIYEPYGFSFITKIARASETLKLLSRVPNIKNVANTFKQFFILGIRFQGYDENGNPATPNNIYSQDSRNVDPRASGVYEVFYDIAITELKYKLGSGSTIYSIKANNIPTKVGLGTKVSTIHNPVPIVATNVKEAIQGGGEGVTGLFEILNKNERIQYDNKEIEIPNQYAVEFWNEDGDLAPNGEIGSAKLKSPSDLEKMKTAMSNFSYSSQINEANAIGAVVDNNKQLIQFNNGTSIVHAISKIISQSQYLEKALQVVYTTADEPESENTVDQPPVKWYNCTPRVEILGFDRKRQDWAYKITYVIQPYETPATFSAFTKSTQYYGPVKRYRYWFTGQNSEILNYEQTLNNNYFMVALTGNQSGEASGTGAPVPIATGRRQPEDRQNRNNIGFEAQGAYLTNLFDPESILNSKIKILGDPDFLMSGVPESINQVYNQFYTGGSFTINPTGGQVFIEIDFNEAVDYDHNSGTLNINESIMIWPYPPQIARFVKGVSFMVLSVTSTFSKGIFTQDLDLVLNQFPNVKRNDQDKTNDREQPTTSPSNNSNIRTAPDPKNISKQVYERTGVNPSNIQGGRGNIIPPRARPNSNDDNQSIPGKTPLGGSNISDTPAA